MDDWKITAIVNGDCLPAARVKAPDLKAMQLVDETLRLGPIAARARFDPAADGAPSSRCFEMRTHRNADTDD